MQIIGRLCHGIMRRQFWSKERKKQYKAGKVHGGQMVNIELIYLRLRTQSQLS